MISIQLSLPILLIIDLNQSPAQEWRCADKVVITSKSGSDPAVVYHLVTRIFHSETQQHYISRFRTNLNTVGGRPVVYDYDSMLLGGTAQEIPQSKVSLHLAGTDSEINIRSSFSTAVAVYQLQGGTSTQQHFLKTRLDRIAKAYHFHLSQQSVTSLPGAEATLTRPHVSRVPDADRYWLSHTRKHIIGTVDYDSNQGGLIQNAKIQSALTITHPSLTPVTPGTLDSFWKAKEPTACDQNFPVIKDGDQLPIGVDTVEASPDLEQTEHGQLVRETESVLRVSTSPPPPDRESSPFPVACRCGASGNGNNSDVLDGLSAIECDSCHTWSHTACQLRGRASVLGKGEVFICDECDPRYALGILSVTLLPPGGDTARRRSTRQAVLSTALSSRLMVGRGALVRVGIFWYPARLLMRRVDRNGDRFWRVSIWRLAECLESAPITSQWIPEADVRDELWQDRHARRQIRLGKWTLASSIPEPDTALADPRAHPFSAEIDTILRPHLETLISLMSWSPEPVADSPVAMLSEDDVPVLKFMRLVASRSRVSAEREGMVVHTGEMSIKERCQITNWIDVSIPGASSIRPTWITGPLNAHAITLILADRHQSKYTERPDCPLLDSTPEGDLARRRFVLKHAWDYQINAINARKQKPVNVDYECLLTFERRLFEISKASGLAGFYQWGKDAGDLQQNWFPYSGVPSEWTTGDLEDGDEDMLAEGPGYMADQPKDEAATIEHKTRPEKPRPRPRPRRGSRGGKRR